MPRSDDDKTSDLTSQSCWITLPRHSDVGSFCWVGPSFETGLETGTGGRLNHAAGFASFFFGSEEAATGTGYDAVIRTVHVGHRMDMLLRGEDMWRDGMRFQFSSRPFLSFSHLRGGGELNR